MRKTILIVIAAVATFTAAKTIAGPDQELEADVMRCDALLPDGQSAADCYDKLAQRYPEHREELEANARLARGIDDLNRTLDGIKTRMDILYPEPEWETWQEVDPIDDKVTVAAAIDEDSATSILRGRIRFVAFCRDRQTTINIQWRDYIDGDEKTVKTRVGEEKAREALWHVSASKTVTILDNGTEDLLRDMMASDKFAAQVTPYGGGPLTAVFDTSGMVEALKPIMEACDWSL